MNILIAIFLGIVSRHYNQCCGANRIFSFFHFLSKFSKATSGNVLVTAAIALPLILAAIGATVDYALVSSQKSRLQQAVDAAALATAREMSLSDARTSRLTAVAKTVVESNLGNDSGPGAQSSADVSIKIDQNEMEVIVAAVQTVEPIFGDFGFNVDSITASAQARVIGTTRVCVIGLEERSAGAIALNQSARMTGKGCAVFSNSTNYAGIKSRDNSMITASIICSAGGKVGGKANFSPEPLTDCPPFEDPLADRPEPVIGSCDANNLVIDNQRITLSPGTYCGGIKVLGASEVTLRPGIYILKGGPLRIKDDAKITGKYVGFFFAGLRSTLFFGKNTVIDLEAPKDGPMAGILIFEKRRGVGKRRHFIFSNNARNLLGTVYLARGILYIDADAPIADQSAYTVIIANQIELYSGLNLVLNTNYDDTDIPVPAGVKGLSENIVLTQ